MPEAEAAVDVLHDHGANIEAYSVKGETTLQRSAYVGQSRATWVLIER